MSRKTTRETTFRLVYETIVTNDINQISVDMTTNEMSIDDKEYFQKIFYGINECNAKLEAIIRQFARDFNYERPFKVDIAILMVSIYEILYMDDIPYRVSANEAVELAKLYSTDKSASYINGILASVIKNREVLLWARK